MAIGYVVTGRRAADQLFVDVVYAFLIVAPLAHVDGAVLSRLFSAPAGGIRIQDAAPDPFTPSRSGEIRGEKTVSGQATRTPGNRGGRRGSPGRCSRGTHTGRDPPRSRRSRPATRAKRHLSGPGGSSVGERA